MSKKVDVNSKRWKIFFFVLIGLSALTLLFIFSMAGAESRFIRELAAEGWPRELGQKISGLRLSALGHMLVLMLLFCATVYVARCRTTWSRMRPWMGAFLVMVVLMDAAWLSRKYIKTMPPSYIAKNVVTEAIRAELGSQRVAMVRQDSFYNLFLVYTFPFNEISYFNIDQMPRMPADYEAWLKECSGDTLRLWQQSAVGILLGPTGLQASLEKDSRLRGKTELLLRYAVRGDEDGNLSFATVMAAQQGTHEVVKLNWDSPKYTLAGSWEQVSPDNVFSRLADRRFPLFKKVLLTDANLKLPPSGSDGSAGTVEILEQQVSGRVRLKLIAERPAVLRVANKFDPDWRVFLDGKSVEPFRVDGIALGVEIPAGEHDAELYYRSRLHPPLYMVQIAGLLLVLGALLWGFIRRKPVSALTLLLILPFCGGCWEPAEGEPTVSELSYSQLVERLVKQERVVDMSWPGAQLISTWDRSGGNDDYSHFLSEEGDWVVLADLQGPGYISRLWCTGMQDDVALRFIFDGEDIVDSTIKEWIGRKGGMEHLPLRGYEPYCWFSWEPITFEKSLKVLAAKPAAKDKFYYQICWNKLPLGVSVPSFNDVSEDEKSAALARFTDAMDWLVTPETRELSGSVELTIGRNELKVLNGPGMISELGLKLDCSGIASAGKRVAVLRELMLEIYWDGAAEPSVVVPVGDFFGSFWSATSFESALMGRKDGRFYSRFPMPYSTSARIVINNESGSIIPVEFDLKIADQPVFEQPAYFHSSWRRSGRQQFGQPHTVLRVKGKGRYAGCVLGLSTMAKSWWALESDESMYVDGETRPSWQGTGLEDYFNGGWYYGNVIASPFHGLLFKAPYRTVQYRLHQVDPVDFTESFNMVFERGPKQEMPAELESIAFYYMEQPQRADSPIMPAAMRQPTPYPLTEATIMMELLCDERFGDAEAAKERIDCFTERFPDKYKDVLAVRRKRYDEPLELPEGKALAGLYASTKAEIILDGKVILNTSDASRMQFKEIDLSPGEHIIVIVAGECPYPSWIQAFVQVGDTFIRTDDTWSYAYGAPLNAQTLNVAAEAWPIYDMIWVKGPPSDPYIYCEPNAYPWTQSRAWGIRAPGEWPAGKRYIVFRKRFICP